MSTKNDDAAIANDCPPNEVTEDYNDEDYEHIDCEDDYDSGSYEYSTGAEEVLAQEDGGDTSNASSTFYDIPRAIIATTKIVKNSDDTFCTDNDEDYHDDTITLRSNTSSSRILADDDRSNTESNVSHHRTSSILSSFVNQFQDLDTAVQNDDDYNDTKPSDVILVDKNCYTHNCSKNYNDDKNDDDYSSTPKTPKLRRCSWEDNHHDCNSDSSSITSWNISMASSHTYNDYNHNANRYTISNSKTDDDEESFTNRSTISGFDAISINGTSQLVCRMCTLINEPTKIVCVACETPLFNNPCTDSDRILAEQLQHMENNNSYQRFERKEMKRKSIFNTSQPLQNLLTQSQEFRMDIYEYVQNFKARYARVNDIHMDAAVAASAIDEDNASDSIGSSTRVGYDVIPTTSMDILVSRFLEKVYRPNVVVSIQYCFTSKLQHSTVLYDSICKNGLMKGCTFSTNIHVAFREQCTSTQQQQESLNGVLKGRLLPIPEGNEHIINLIANRNIIEKMNRNIPSAEQCTGWIVAMVKDNDATHDRLTYIDMGNNEYQEECVTTLLNPYYTLPLVHFDASIRDTKMIQDLSQGLYTVCNDYFGLMDDPQQGSGIIFTTQRIVI